MKKFIFVFFLIGVSLFGCSRPSIYTRATLEEGPLSPRVYAVNFEDGFLLALHALELQRGWQLKYYDKKTGVIDARTHDGDSFNVRVSPLSRSSIKVFAYVDANGIPFAAELRMQASLKKYLAQLDAHLKEFDAKSLR